MMQINAKKHFQRGVTLAELSISVAVISLLIAGTFGGMTMLKAAKIRKAANEFTTIMSAINEFQSQYGYLPGDMPTASKFWATNAVTGSATHDGNGNGKVEDSITPLEDLYVWEHLGNAQLIPGTYTGVVLDGSNKYGVGTNSTNSEPFANGVFSFYVVDDLTYLIRGHMLRLGSLISGGVPFGGVMLAKDAYSIDVKIDDGLASSGMLTTTRNGSGCTDADWNASSANYVLSDLTNATCNLWYWQKKF